MGIIEVLGGSEIDEALLDEVGNEVDVGVDVADNVGNDEELMANVGDGEVVGVK